MNKYLKIPSPRSQLALFLMLIGGAWVVVNLIGLIFLIVSSGSLAGAQTSIASGASWELSLMQGVASVIMFLAPALLFARFVYQDRNLYFLGFRKAERNNFYALAVLILLSAYPMEGWLGQLNKGIPLPAWMVSMERENDKIISSFLSKNSFFYIVTNLFIMAVLPAICEEALFRGVLQRILIRSFKSPWAGIIVTAAIFSAFHMQFEGFLPRMFLGMLLGAVYWYSDSLWPCILAHFFTNGAQVVAASFNPGMITENPSVPVYAALISLVIVVGLLSVMRRQSKVTYAGVYGLENVQDIDEFH